MLVQDSIYDFRHLSKLMTAKYSLSLPKCSACKFFEKLDDVKFEQVCGKNINIKNLEYQNNEIRFIMMYISDIR
jgi:hypothetical protein